MNHASRFFIAPIALVALAAPIVGCSSSSDTTDGGTVADTGTPPTDTGTPTDTGGTDSGTLPTCTQYCTDNLATCGVNGQVKLLQYIDQPTCEAMCAKFGPGKAGETSGDTLGCRAYHTNAAKSDATTHCTHSGPYGGGVCGASRCDDFCKLALAQCPTSAGGPYADMASCMAGCQAAPFDTTLKEIDSTSSSPGTLNCLQYHLEAAFKDPATHCKHITVASGPCKKP